MINILQIKSQIYQQPDLIQVKKYIMIEREKGLQIKIADDANYNNQLSVFHSSPTNWLIRNL